MSDAHQSKEPVVIRGVSEVDEPSVAWGWHHMGMKPIQIFGWICVVLLLCYNFGNHRGHVETIYINVFAVVCALFLILLLWWPHFKYPKHITEHNKPLGHVEPDWNSDQHNLTGVYAQLTDSQLEALNIDPATVR